MGWMSQNLIDAGWPRKNKAADQAAAPRLCFAPDRPAAAAAPPFGLGLAGASQVGAAWVAAPAEGQRARPPLRKRLHGGVPLCCRAGAGGRRCQARRLREGFYGRGEGVDAVEFRLRKLGEAAWHGRQLSLQISAGPSLHRQVWQQAVHQPPRAGTQLAFRLRLHAAQGRMHGRGTARAGQVLVRQWLDTHGAAVAAEWAYQCHGGRQKGIGRNGASPLQTSHRGPCYRLAQRVGQAASQRAQHAQQGRAARQPGRHSGLQADGCLQHSQRRQAGPEGLL